MDDCKHDLPPNTCHLCRGIVQITVKAPSGPRCCSPDCPKTATKQVASLPLCPDHYHRLETQIAKTYTPTPPPLPPKDQPISEGKWEWIYFLQMDDVIKIGVTIRPTARIKHLSTYGRTVTVLALERGDYALEKRLHNRFAEHRARVGLSKELFYPAQPILDYIEHGRHCTFCKKNALPGRLICDTHVDRAGTLARYEQLIGVQLDSPPQIDPMVVD